MLSTSTTAPKRFVTRGLKTSPVSSRIQRSHVAKTFLVRHDFPVSPPAALPPAARRGPQRTATARVRPSGPTDSLPAPRNRLGTRRAIRCSRAFCNTTPTAIPQDVRTAVGGYPDPNRWEFPFQVKQDASCFGYGLFGRRHCVAMLTVVARRPWYDSCASMLGVSTWPDDNSRYANSSRPRLARCQGLRRMLMAGGSS